MNNSQVEYSKNEPFIKVFGLKRSGNHAVINWLLGLHSSFLFFNNVEPYKNPLENFSPISCPPNVRTLTYRKNNEKIESNVQIVTQGGAIANGPLLCSFEQLDLNQVNIDKIDQTIFQYLGNYYNSCNIIILRNPLNMITSYAIWKINKKRKAGLVPRFLKLVLGLSETKRSKYDKLEKSYLMDLRPKIEKLLEKWKSYATIAINYNQGINENFIPIIYDHWLVSKNYRNKIAKTLGFDNHDKNMEFISDAGGGSSFNGKRLTKPDEEKLLTRWKQVRDKNFQKLLSDLVEKDYELQKMCSQLSLKKWIMPIEH